MEEEYYEALTKCGKRYIEMTSTRIADDRYWGSTNKVYKYEDLTDLSKFINEFLNGCSDKLPLMKLNRWLGYIQGSLIQWGITTVQIEREWTRPLFRHLDFNAGMVESVDAEDSKSFVERRGFKSLYPHQFRSTEYVERSINRSTYG